MLNRNNFKILNQRVYFSAGFESYVFIVVVVVVVVVIIIIIII